MTIHYTATPRRDACGHHTCAGQPTCTYWPGTYTPTAEVDVDHCAGTDCSHCNPQED